MAFTITSSEMREINRSAIMELIRKNSPISHTEIAEKLDISLPTVMRIGSSLIEEGWIHELDEKEWTGGRRRSLLEFNFEGKLVIGIDIGGTKMYGAVSTLAGEILFDHSMPLNNAKGDEAYKLIYDLIHFLIDKARATRKEIIGIGVGVPGVADLKFGTVSMAPVLNWNSYPLRDNLERDFDFPIIIENDANLAAIGELWFGANKDVRSMVLIYIGVGLGAGIIVDGGLHNGAHFSAGQIHHMMPSCEYLEYLYGDSRQMDQSSINIDRTGLGRNILGMNWSEGILESLTTEDIFPNTSRDEIWAEDLIHEALDFIALLLANINSFFDPELFILGGRIIRTEEEIISQLTERTNLLAHNFPPIAITTLGEKAVVMGTIIKVLYKTERHYFVRAMK